MMVAHAIPRGRNNVHVVCIMRCPVRGVLPFCIAVTWRSGKYLESDMGWGTRHVMKVQRTDALDQ